MAGPQTPHLYGDVVVHGAPKATAQATDPTGLVRRDQLDALQTFLANRANHNGSQTASTISDLQTVLDARFQALVGAAPEALDTLGEIAAQLTRDESAAAALTQALATLAGRVTATEARLDKHLERTIGDGTATSFTITHGWNSDDVRVEVLDLTQSRLTVHPLVTRPDSTKVVIDFAGTAVATSSHRVLLDLRT